MVMIVGKMCPFINYYGPVPWFMEPSKVGFLTELRTLMILILS